MMPPATAIAWVLGALGAMLALLKAIERWLRPPPELTRKLLHVGMGLVVLSFPWLFAQQWPVTLLAIVAGATLLALKLVPVLRDSVGTILRVQRPSLGEIYFPVAVGVMFWISGHDKLLYCVPMAIMILADTVAALIGLAYGRVRYVTSEGLKSAEGSIAFFTIAFLSVHVPLLMFTTVGRTQSLLIALIIGMLSMLLEAVSWRGLDNLLIPIGAFAFLKLYLPMSAYELVFRLIASIVLTIVALSWRRRASLDDSALLGAALFCYGAWMLGGWVWLIGPAVVFFTFVLIWPRLQEQREHSVFALLSVISVPLMWLALYVRDHRASAFRGYITVFGVHLAMYGVSHLSTQTTARVRSLLLRIASGWGLILLQAACAAAPWRAQPQRLPATFFATSLLGVISGAAILNALWPLLFQARRSNALLYQVELVCGLIGSIIAVLLS